MSVSLNAAVEYELEKKKREKKKQEQIHEDVFDRSKVTCSQFEKEIYQNFLRQAEEYEKQHPNKKFTPPF